MANKCAICGADINLVQQQKLADGNYICRKTCQKKGMKAYFDFIHSDLGQVQDHIKQVEVGTKIFNDVFVPAIKGPKKARPKQYGTGIFVLEDQGLMALARPDYKYFIFGKYYPQACVFRLGDLRGYEPTKITKKPDGTAADQNKKYIHFSFMNTMGLCDFDYEYSGDAKKLAKDFDTIFGIQKTLGNIKNTWKSQIDATKAVVDAAKAVASGDEASYEDKGTAAAEALDVAIYGDRTELNRKADAVLSKYSI
ncbi:MAG: hypothetical protein IJ757_05510 [Clostridiales bacterium]|nr:hypothetical protein [Clostridiales bacterium]